MTILEMEQNELSILVRISFREIRQVCINGFGAGSTLASAILEIFLQVAPAELSG